MKQPHRHTGAPGALIVSITHEPTRGERAPRDCQVFRSRSPDSGQPEPLQIQSESTGRAVFPQLPPLGPAEEQKPLAFKRESPSPRLSPCGIPRMLPCRLRPSWEVAWLRPIPPRCESGRVFTLPGHHSRTQAAFRRLHVSWPVWSAVKDCNKGRADRSFATTHSSRNLTHAEQRSRASPSSQRPGARSRRLIARVRVRNRLAAAQHERWPGGSQALRPA